MKLLFRLHLLLLLCHSIQASEPASWLEPLVSSAEKSFASEVPDKAAWLANRGRYRRELKEMLGLDPEPPRGDLKPVITGIVPGEGIMVEKLHFQSLPGLYVTANFYRPASAQGPLPTILYLSGHGPTYSPDGVSCGNKVSYQHHGIWFARHGYNCLIIDTVQWGEIQGEHWGTYKLNRWWWASRGYTPAGVETWAGIRALDYLATRAEVDMEKIGVTGRSGGGAYTWYLTAVDERVKVAAPTAGITTLRDHVINDCIEGHCDCMYMVNLYDWDFDKLAALAAPRPLLISNTDKDTIFPLGGVIRIYESTRRLYQLLDAENNLGLQIAEGPHKDTQPLNAGAFHWFDRFLKGADLMAVIREPAVPAFKPEQLRVFTGIPIDEINTRIDETFVPMFTPPPVPETKEAWVKLRDEWMKMLREKIIPSTKVSVPIPPTLPLDHHQLRRAMLAGHPLDALLTIQKAATLDAQASGGELAVHQAAGDGAVQLLYASLLAKHPGHPPLTLEQLPVSHMQGPVLQGILKYMDIPHALAMAAERGKVCITGRREDWAWALQTAEKQGFAANLKIVPAMELVEVKKIWDAAPHQAFTSLIKFRDEWFTTFREGSSHVPGTDGAVRVLVSKDSKTWESAALITESGVDLRDPKFCTAGPDKLMLSMGGSFYDGTPAPGARRKSTGARSRVAFSTDGRTWSAPQPVCTDHQWLWRVTQRPPEGPPFDPPGVIFPFYGISYSTNVPEAEAKLSLWQSQDGINYSRAGNPDPGRQLWLNETTLRFDGSGNMMALARSDRKGTNAFFGISQPPYQQWSWTDTGHIIQGPDFIRLKDGRLIYSGRDIIEGKANTTVGFLTPAGHAMPMLILPSSGDTSYPGLAEGADGELLVSYYSSHEGKSAIYFARVKLAP